MGYNTLQFPAQLLPFSKKNKKWRKQVMDWADSKTYFNYDVVRNSINHKKVNYDLLNGKIHMDDIKLLINPENIQAKFIPDAIQHYPIINSKLNVLRGEEASRIFDARVVITNPNSISEIEEEKKQQVFEQLKTLVSNQQQDQNEYNKGLDRINSYFTYEYQDLREIRANALLNHYKKELNMATLFNQGFMDAMAVGEEIYKVDIVSGEPVIERVNPMKIQVFRSGYSNKIEDADMIILEDYWSPGKIIDTYYDSLSQKDMDYIEKLPDTIGHDNYDSMANIDPRNEFINVSNLSDDKVFLESIFGNIAGEYASSDLPYDLAGNIRVLRVFWKSKRKIKRVKSYNIETGEEEYDFYPENYVLNKDKGEEEKIYYINEAWEGTKIGKEIYVNMRPRQVQFNRLSNPSRCHFGIIGTIYNLNDDKPFSMVDIMKPYNYMYDIIHDRLNKILARNWGKLLEVDLAKMPKGWDMDKWMYYARTCGLLVSDSFAEGRIGASTGKLAGSLNNNTTGAVDAELGNSIQMYVNLLEFIKNEMSEVVGISKQREGQVANRETVGGVERATLQSTHITEWLFTLHEDLKKRVYEAFLEMAKISLRGKSKKFPYILGDNSLKMVDIDGDEFSENDYGLVVDNSQNAQELNQKLDTLAQAALQNQMVNFSTIIKMFNTTSLAEKQRMIEENERKMQEQAQQAQQQQEQAQQQAMQQQAQMEQQKIQIQLEMNQRDNDTKLQIAQMQANGTIRKAQMQAETELFKSEAQFYDNSTEERRREFDEKIALDKQKLDETIRNNKRNEELKLKQINKQKSSMSK